MNDFVRIPLDTEININNVITMHISNYDNEYVFNGESHDFWELECVYKGSAMVIGENKQYNLKEGEIIFHKPNEFHAIRTSNKITTTIVVVTFDADGSSMPFFIDKIVSLNERNLDLLNDLIEEGKRVFEFAQITSNMISLRSDTNKSPKSYQIFKNLLELFLLSFIHPYELESDEEPKHSNSLISGKVLVQKVMDILKEKKYSSINIPEMCSHLNVSKSYLSSLFKKYTGKNIVDYYNSLKIYEAKKMIKLNKKNITEISEILGFSSIHYFSRIFKQYAGISPLNYSKSVDLKDNLLE